MLSEQSPFKLRDLCIKKCKQCFTSMEVKYKGVICCGQLVSAMRNIKASRSPEKNKCVVKENLD